MIISRYIRRKLSDAFLNIYSYAVRHAKIKLVATPLGPPIDRHQWLANIVGTIVVRRNNEVAIKISTLQVECPGMKVLHCMVSDRQHRTTIMGVPRTSHFGGFSNKREQGYTANFPV